MSAEFAVGLLRSCLLTGRLWKSQSETLYLCEAPLPPGWYALANLLMQMKQWLS